MIKKIKSFDCRTAKVVLAFAMIITAAWLCVLALL